MTRPLGRVQQAVLESLREHGGRWKERGIASGWVWGSAGHTAKVLDSLVKRGLVTKSKDGWYKDNTCPTCGRRRGVK